MLTDQEKSKIRWEAKALYPEIENNDAIFSNYEQYLYARIKRRAEREAHIAAVTAERERADKKAQCGKRESAGADASN